MLTMCFIYRSTHNNLRISRILQSLGLFGFNHLQLPLVKFFLNEIIVEKTLRNCRHSCFEFWMKTLKGQDYCDVNAYVEQLEQELARRTSDTTAAVGHDRDAEHDPWDWISPRISSEGDSTAAFQEQKPQTLNTETGNAEAADDLRQADVSVTTNQDDYQDSSSTHSTETADQKQQQE